MKRNESKGTQPRWGIGCNCRSFYPSMDTLLVCDGHCKDRASKSIHISVTLIRSTTCHCRSGLGFQALKGIDVSYVESLDMIASEPWREHIPDRARCRLPNGYDALYKVPGVQLAQWDNSTAHGIHEWTLQGEGVYLRVLMPHLVPGWRPGMPIRHVTLTNQDKSPLAHLQRAWFSSDDRHSAWARRTSGSLGSGSGRNRLLNLQSQDRVEFRCTKMMAGK
jgi:hypothetical protein